MAPPFAAFLLLFAAWALPPKSSTPPCPAMYMRMCVEHKHTQTIQHSELPVRVEAAMALRSFVEELSDASALQPILAQLMDSIFKLMSEVCVLGGGDGWRWQLQRRR